MKIYVNIIVLLLTCSIIISAQEKSGKKCSQSCCEKGIQKKITFVELGSVNCIPCKQMQPVMKAIEEKYSDQVEVIFYDVWKDDQKKYAEEYGIKLIPTQVFLDAEGKEFHRHEGFYPENEIDKLFQSKGLKPKS